MNEYEKGCALCISVVVCMSLYGTLCLILSSTSIPVFSYTYVSKRARCKPLCPSCAYGFSCVIGLLLYIIMELLCLFMIILI